MLRPIAISFTVLIILFFSVFTINIQAQTGYIGNPKIAYWKTGNKSEKIIVIHGGPGINHRYLRPEWDNLSKHGQVIYYDQRGSGMSGKSDDYSWEAHVEDLKQIKEKLSPNRKVILAGSSWGVHLALLYSLKYQDDVKGLILSGATPWNEIKINSGNTPFDSLQKLEKQLNLSSVKKPDLEVELDSIFKQRKKELKSGMSNGTDSLFQARVTKANKRANYETIRSLSSMPSITELEAIVRPTLIIKGREKCKINDGAEELHNILANSALNTLDNSCHDPWFNEPRLFFKLCGSFILQLQSQKN